MYLKFYPCHYMDASSSFIFPTPHIQCCIVRIHLELVNHLNAMSTSIKTTKLNMIGLAWCMAWWEFQLKTFLI